MTREEAERLLGLAREAEPVGPDAAKWTERLTPERDGLEAAARFLAQRAGKKRRRGDYAVSERSRPRRASSRVGWTRPLVSRRCTCSLPGRGSPATTTPPLSSTPRVWSSTGASAIAGWSEWNPTTSAAAAERCFAECAEVRNLDDSYEAAMAHLNQAALAFARGDRERAAQLFGQTQSTLVGAGIVLDPDDAFEVEWLGEQLGVAP